MTWPSHGSGRPTWPAAAARPLIYQLRAVPSSNDSCRRLGPSLRLGAAPSLCPRPPSPGPDVPRAGEERRAAPRARPQPAPPPAGPSRGHAPRRLPHPLPSRGSRPARSRRRCRRAWRRATPAVTSPGSRSRTQSSDRGLHGPGATDSSRAWDAAENRGQQVSLGTPGARGADHHSPAAWEPLFREHTSCTMTRAPRQLWCHQRLAGTGVGSRIGLQAVPMLWQGVGGGGFDVSAAPRL